MVRATVFTSSAQAGHTAHVAVERKRHITRVPEHSDKFGLFELFQVAISDLGAL